MCISITSIDTRHGLIFLRWFCLAFLVVVVVIGVFSFVYVVLACSDWFLVFHRWIFFSYFFFRFTTTTTGRNFWGNKSGKKCMLLLWRQTNRIWKQPNTSSILTSPPNNRPIFFSLFCELKWTFYLHSMLPWTAAER